MEKRKYPRKNICTDVIFAGADVNQRAVTIDISEGGVWISTSEPLPVGAKIDLSINDDWHGKIISAEGLVARMEHGIGMAVEFFNPPTGIDNFVSAFG